MALGRNSASIVSAPVLSAYTSVQPFAPAVMQARPRATRQYGV